MRIVGLVGRAGSGKDYMASILQRALDFMPLALADALKVKCAVEYGVPIGAMYGDNRPGYVRTLLQRVGTDEVREKFDEDYWWRTLDAWMSVLTMRMGTASFVVPDVRFKNEAVWVMERGGIVIRLCGRGREMTEGQTAHRSEAESDTIDPHTTIDNGPSFSREIRPGEVLAEAEMRMLSAVVEHFGIPIKKPALLTKAFDAAVAQRNHMAGR